MKTRLLPTLLLLAALSPAYGQTTDGHHSDQLIPVAVDSGSFTQRFTFSTPNGFPVTVHARFLPGTGTAQAATGAVSCDDIVIPAGGAIAVASLRTLCPSLVAGSAFGLLTLKSADSSDGMYSDIPVFAAYSRVSNPQGNGFSVEAFAAHVFTSATTRIEGLRRRAATADSPAFQTNCFLGQMPKTAIYSGATRVNYQLKDNQGSWAGYVDVKPGELVRLLDVFAAAGAPAGDHEDATLVVDPAGSGWQGMVAFCTVQDNTSFGADFRIAKTGFGLYGIASEEGTAAREFTRKDDPLGRTFEIGPGSSANTHVVYFRNPDTVQCRLLDPVSSLPLDASSGLEMRVYNVLESVLGGGDGKTATGLIVLGDKAKLPAFDNRYYIEVESNETHAASSRDYRLYCASGSGNTAGYDIVRYQEPVDRF